MRRSLLALLVAVLVTVGVSAQVRKTGPLTVRILRLNSVTNPTVYYTDADLLTMFGPGSAWQAYFNEQSYKQLGPWTIAIEPVQTLDDSAAPVNYNTCPGGGTALPAFGLNYLRNKYGSTASVTDYQILLVPDYNCVQGGYDIYATSGGNRTIAQGRVSSGVLAHECGHVLGIKGTGTGVQFDEGHAQAEHCDNVSCPTSQYGGLNTYSAMGQMGGINIGRGQYSAMEKVLAGWLTAPGLPAFPGRPRIAVLTQPGDCVLEPFERPLTSTGIVACSVSINGSPQIVIEARVDGDKQGNNRGVILNQGSTLIKLRDLEHQYANVDKYALDPGEKFTDGPLTFETLSFDQTGARVRVSITGSTPPPSPCGAPSCSPGKPGRPSLR